MNIENVPIASLTLDPHNARAHPDKNIDAIKLSLTQFGQQRPILVNTDGTIVAGNGTYIAAQALDWDTINVVRTDLTATQAMAYAIADNKTGELSEWDDDVLLQQLEELSGVTELFDKEFDLSSLGFDDTEIAELLETPVAIVEDEAPIDRAAELQEEWDTKSGQLWVIEGKQTHRLLCGDSTKSEDVERVMGDEKMQLVHADPPYGMGKENDGVQNDNLYREKLDAFQMAWWTTARPHVDDNGSAYIWGNAKDLWRLWYVGGLKDSERLTFRNEIIWSQVTGVSWGKDGMTGLRQYAPMGERCLFFMLGEQGFNNNADNYWEGFESVREYLDSERRKCGWSNKDVAKFFGFHPRMADHWFSKSQWSFPTREQYERLQAEACKHDAFKREHDELKREHDELKREHDELKRAFYATRAYFDNTHDNMTDVWDFKRVVGEERHGHATPKPVAMMARAIVSSCPVGGRVFEPFLGSGTTMLAAEQSDRCCHGIEIDPRYVAVILERMTTHGCKCTLSEL